MLLLAVLLAGPFMVQADTTIVNVATPSIEHDLGASGTALELVVGAYLIAFAVLLISGARLGQTHGYRRMLRLGVALFTLASLLCGLAPGPLPLIAARVLQGAGAALMFPQTLTGIQLRFTGAARARAIGSYALALSSGAVAGQMLGGVLTSAFGWRAIFLVNLPVGLATLALSARLPADERLGSRRVDAPGTALLSLAIVLLVLPLALGRSAGWPAWTWICLAASVPALAAFAAVERRVEAPLVNLGAIARRPVAFGLAGLALATSTYYALLFTLAQFLQGGLGDSAAASGLTLVPWVAAFGLASRLVARVRIEPAAGCALVAGAFAAISGLLFSGHHEEGLLLAALGIGGLGLGINFATLLGHVCEAVGPGYAADISGVSTTLTTVAGSVAVAGFGTLYLGEASGAGATRAFALVTALLAAVALLAAAAASRATGSSRTPWRRTSAVRSS